MPERNLNGIPEELSKTIETASKAPKEFAENCHETISKNVLIEKTEDSLSESPKDFSKVLTQKLPKGLPKGIAEEHPKIIFNNF